MADNEGVNTPLDQEAPQLSAETLALAEAGRTGAAPPSKDPNVKPEAKPDWLPEKFLKDGKPDYEALARSYSELEKKIGAKPADTPAPDAEKDGKDGDAVDDKGVKIADRKEPEKKDGKQDDKSADAPTAAVQTAFDDAAKAYAETGELGDDHFAALEKVGIPRSAVELYMAGVKAQERALEEEVFKIAGGRDDYVSAAKWAAENWSDEKIAKFDKALADSELRDTAVTGLMASFREATKGAPPAEGKLLDVKGGSSNGDLYRNKEEFLADLAKVNKIVDRNEQQVARKAAIEKLERSKKAGTVKEVTPRRPMF